MKRQLLLLVIMLLTMVAANTFAEEVNIDGLWYELVSEAKEAKVIKNKYNYKYCGNIVIPKTVESQGSSYSVTRIENNAFNGCSDLISIIIPNSLTSIGDCAFYGCSSLTSITIPNTVKSIGGSAFHFCI